MKKLILTLAAICSALTLSAETTLIDGSQADAFNCVRNNLTEVNGVLQTGDNIYARSKTIIKPEPGKAYKLTGEFRLAEPTDKAPVMFFGMDPMNAQEKTVSVESVTRIINELAEVATEVKVGDLSIELKPLSARWLHELKFGWRRIALNAKEDRSDLPNKTVINSYINTKVPPEKLPNGNYKITFNSKVNFGCPAGTKVALHGGTDTYQFATPKKLTSEWQTFRGVFGLTGGPNIRILFRPSTEKTCIVILCIANKGAKIECRNIKLTQIN